MKKTNKKSNKITINQANKKRLKVLLFLAVVTGLLYFLIGGVSSATRLYRLRKEVKRMEQEIITSQTTIDSLVDVVENLKTDTAFIERIAREKLGMAKKNEKIYKFVEEN